VPKLDEVWPEGVLKVKCPTCQTENREDVKFCEQCGASMELECPNCKARAPRGRKFCGRCGEALSAPSSAPPERAPPTEAERKNVTALFSDLSGYTAMSEKLDPEEVKEITSRIFGEAARIVARYDGSVEKYIGDAVVILFGVPNAHEDDHVRAIRAAKELHEMVDTVGLDYEEKIGGRLTFHSGIATGLIVTGEEGAYGAAGDTINLASRLSDLAPPGEILVGENTYLQTKGVFPFKKGKPVSVKGKAWQVTPYKLLDERLRTPRGPATQKLSSPLVGRIAEISAIEECVNRLLDGQGGILTIVGEAGLGKSRLVAEIRNAFAHGNLLWLEGRTLSYGRKMSYWPFREILWQYAGITDDDDETEAWNKFETSITVLCPLECEEILTYLASLIGLEVKGRLGRDLEYLEGESTGKQVYFSSRRFFERAAGARPLVLVFEDLHWADESSVLLIQHLFPLVDRVPLLICGVSRPEVNVPAARLRESALKDHERRYTEIRLNPLSSTECTDLMNNLLSVEKLPSRVRQEILQKADGNPFFLEEIMRTLVDKGAVRPESGRWKVTSQIKTITIPDTIQGVIMARIDRLDDGLKQVLKTASVIGRTFPYRLLREVTDAAEELDSYLDRLVATELIREKQRTPELEYIFKHALVQESAYESILLKKRHELHGKVASAIERLFFDRLEEFSGVLAYHYAKAELWEKAQEYLFKAGDQAGRIAADAEALTHYREALETYTRVFGDKWDPILRASLERKMGEAFYRRGEHEKANECLQSALGYFSKPLPEGTWGVRLAILREIVVQIGYRLVPGRLVKPSRRPDLATAEEARIYEAQGLMHIVTNVEKTLLSSLRRLNFSERRGYHRGMAMGASFVQGTAVTLGLFRIAEYYGRRALAAAEATEDPGALGYVCTAMSLQEVVMGRLTSATTYGRRAVESLSESGYWDPRVWGFAMAFKNWWCDFSGDYAEALRTGQALIRFGEDAGDLEAWCFGLNGLGSTQYFTGQLDEAIYNLKRAIDLAEAIPDHANRIFSGGYLAKCNLRRDNLAEALGVLRQTEEYQNRHHMKRYFVSAFLHSGLAEACLSAAERSSGGERSMWLKESKHRCDCALKSSEALFRPLLPEAMLLEGTYEWLREKPSAAEKWWNGSLNLADRMCMPYHSGLVHLEMGRRLKKRAHLERAEAFFRQVGAEWDLAQNRGLLEKIGPTSLPG
jgi:class 3 adenylate cyclase/tetratricopeptide (TPR) repeat protein